jgi:hypothetical protein
MNFVNSVNSVRDSFSAKTLPIAILAGGLATRLRKAMRSAGLQEVRFRFDFEGTKILTMD